jgi:mannose-6-phosphate isomerase class I
MVYKLRENRIERTYQGGLNLDKMNGKANPKVSSFPEDWICSLIYANNLTSTDKSGLTMLADEDKYLLDLLKENSFDTDRINALVKYLDSGVNLQPQLHPTGALAQKHFQKKNGKDEFYYILETYSDDSCIYLGFKEDMKSEDVAQAIENQEMDFIYASMNRIEVKKGDCLFIPSGSMHSIGKDIMMIEIMEMSDLTFRIKYEPETKDYNLIGQSPQELCDIFMKKTKTAPSDQYLKAQSVNTESIEALTKGKFKIRKEITSDSFACPKEACVILTLSGKGCFSHGTTPVNYGKYDRFFSLPKAEEDVMIEPEEETEFLFIMI